MPAKKFTRTQLRVTDITESDDTLHAAVSTAECTTPTLLQEAEIDHDNALNDVLEGQRNIDTPFNDDTGDVGSQIADEDCRDMATQNRLMLKMLH